MEKSHVTLEPLEIQVKICTLKSIASLLYREMEA